MADTDFTGYLAWNLGELLHRLALVTSAIVDLLPMEAEAKAQELTSKRTAWTQSEAASVTERGHSATYEAVPATITRIETENQIVALREEKGFLHTVIDVRQKELEHARRQPVLVSTAGD